jgi:hypothetical protein
MAKVSKEGLCQSRSLWVKFIFYWYMYTFFGPPLSSAPWHPPPQVSWSRKICILWYLHPLLKCKCLLGWWLMPVILVTQEAEIRRIAVWSQPEKDWWSGSRCRPWVQAPVPQKKRKEKIANNPRKILSILSTVISTSVLVQILPWQQALKRKVKNLRAQET